MNHNELLKQKRSNLQKALNREEGSFVPNVVAAGSAMVAHVGKTLRDVIDDPMKYAEALTDVYKEMWVDGYFYMGAVSTFKLQEIWDTAENFFGPDEITLEHVQLSPMKAEEYPLLIEDPDRYVSEVLLPRKYPKLFADQDYAKKALKVYAEEKFHILIACESAARKMMAEKYGIEGVLNLQERIEPPLDLIFDYFRGFRGTLTDLRRQNANVRNALEKLWNVRCAPFVEKPFDPSAGFAYQVPHIPAYLSPKQFEELYWPHEKKYIERVAAAGGKIEILMEGRWEHIWHHFLELPKDCCILHVDDDDIFKAYAELGQHQIICGGLRAADVRLKSFDAIKDDIKRVIDTCAPGGGFLFATDKIWSSPGDMNQTLIEAMNFAHEYSSK